MHILYLRDQPIAAAERFQRLCMEMAEEPDEQADMRITSGRVTRGVKVLR
jgi:hypothetical protein